ncbi:MAG: hypothetical protein IKI67_07465, partial [Bacteroidales bacterium]|nr:hypothetical protein [Bacteroidales bacterium]
MSAVLVTASAQVIKGAEAQTLRGPYETNRLFDNIFFGVAGGINLYQGEQDHSMDLEKRLAPAWQAYLGKWVTPSFGLRIGYYGGRQKGFYHNDDASSPYVPAWSGNPFVDPVDNYKWGYEQRFQTHSIRADVMWNISNAISGYRSDRFLDFAPYLGIGAIMATTVEKDPILDKYLKEHELGVTLGLYSMFRISKALDITLDVNQTMVNQILDGEAKDSRREFIGNVSLGLAYQFKNREFSRAHAPVDVTSYSNKIKDLSSALDAVNAKNKKLNSDIEEAKKNVTPEYVVRDGSEKVVPSPFAVYFQKGKSKLSEDQVMSIQFYVQEAMAKSKDYIFVIKSAADSATGSAATN